MSDQLISFSNQPMQLDAQITIHTQQSLGLTAEVLIREQARKLPIYNQEIHCDSVGKDEIGKPILVNTVGRWLFGVPGYKGNIRMTSEGKTVVIYYPKESDPLVHDLLVLLKNEVEGITF